MSYLVLARKWRPRDFQSLVGQEHVVRALTHALSTQRLHHAWLFTGTRGVGKTTLSRILAKSLNCETGITATPCGQCTACTQIDSGRFVDYVELDAASNRGVEEMTQLLEQAVYAPSSGRFKVYMIDEVHMLSGHAFNAMLKTLEEPPPHVKFILATTDPQKIPATVLSRCLQFNLKQMPPDSIASYLAKVLKEENVGFEEPALRLIGQAASGSMRDALSLTDQAIAFSAGQLTTDAVRSMLGTVDQTHLVQLLQALVEADASRVVEVAQSLSERGLSLRAALGDLSILLSKVAIMQRVGTCGLDEPALEEPVRELASRMPADLVQLFYTVAVHSRQELALAPDEYAGFLMVCLRMLGFVDGSNAVTLEKKSLNPATAPTRTETPGRPQTAAAQVPAPARAPEESVQVSQPAGSAADAGKESGTSQEPGSAAAPTLLPPERLPAAPPDTEIPPWVDDPESSHALTPSGDERPEPPEDDGRSDAMGDARGVAQPSLAPRQAEGSAHGMADQSLQSLVDDWPRFVESLQVSGMARQLARQSVCVAVDEHRVCLRVQTGALAQGSHVQRLKDALQQALGRALQLEVGVGDLGQSESAHQLDLQQQKQRLEQAERQLNEDPFVRALIRDLGAQILPGSVRP